MTPLKLHAPSRSNSSPLAQPNRKQAAKTRPGEFTLADFKKTIGQMKKLGPLKWILNWIPGMGKVAEMMGEADPDGDLRQIEGIMDAMTREERENPEVIDVGRCRRIAAGSGTDPAEVNRLLKEFSAMAGMMEQMAGMTKLQQMRHPKQMADSGMFDRGGRITVQKRPGKRE
ncbi:MAG TPA: hypothetical protein VGH74_20400 [Planctomycetaceae bacterium]|jgi:signal recognition particle subunit SRP54